MAASYLVPVRAHIFFRINDSEPALKIKVKLQYPLLHIKFTTCYSIFQHSPIQDFLLFINLPSSFAKKKNIWEAFFSSFFP